MHINFKSQSLQNARLINEMTDLKNRNEFLESELVCLKEVQEECGKAKHISSLLNSKCESLKEELKKERDIIRIWTSSGRTTHEALYNKWKRGLGYTDVDEEVKSTKQEKIFHPNRPLCVPVKFVDYEPALKFKMNKDQTTKSVESELELSKKSLPNSKGILECNMYHKDNCDNTHQLTDKDSN